MKKYYPKEGTMVTRTKFLFLPKTLRTVKGKKVTRYLEFVKINYSMTVDGWVEDSWDDIEVEET